MSDRTTTDIADRLKTAGTELAAIGTSIATTCDRAITALDDIQRETDARIAEIQAAHERYKGIIGAFRSWLEDLRALFGR